MNSRDSRRYQELADRLEAVENDNIALRRQLEERTAGAEDETLADRFERERQQRIDRYERRRAQGWRNLVRPR